MNTDTTEYYTVRIDHFPSVSENDLSHLSFDFNASGISEDLNFRQTDLTLDPQTIPTKLKTLLVYFEKTPPQEFFEQVRELAPQAQLKLETEVSKDWLEEWKKGFHAFNLVGSYWLVPSWETSPVDEHHTIHIDPGMAFGTGTHATTKMMSALIHQVLKSGDSKNLLDVGCGTGILSILAEKLGSPEVVGLEIDPIARDVARRNILLNNCDLVSIPDSELAEINGEFDMVGANIIAGVLLKLKTDLLRVLKPGGDLLLSGILTEHEEQFIEDFMEGTSLRLARRLEHDNWVAFHLVN